MPTGTTTTLEQYDAAPVGWTWQVPTNYPAAQTIPSGFNQGLGLVIVPTSPPWPVNDTLLAEAGGLATFVTSEANLTVATAHATENVDGSGAGYDLAATVGPGLAQFFGAYGSIGTSANPDTATLGGVFQNPTDRTLYLQSMTGTLIRFVLIPHTEVVPPGPEQPPTTPPPPSNLPPGVVARKLLEKANPGFTCELTRRNQYADLVTVGLGQKIVLTVEGVRGRLGMHSRGNVITKMRWVWRAEASPVPQETLMCTYVLEKIIGTLIPGSGTTTPEQDEAGDGADISAFARWDTAGAGWGAGWAA